MYRDQALKISELRVYCAIEAAGNGKKDMWAKTKTIAEELGLSYDGTRRAIASLEKKGYITRWWEGKVRHLRVGLNDPRVGLNDPRGVGLNDPMQGGTEQSPHEDYKEKTIKEVYGEFKNVRLKRAENEALVKLMGSDSFYAMVTRMDEYIEQTGKKYKNCYLAMRNWHKRDEAKNGNGSARSKNNYCTRHPVVKLDSANKCYLCEDEK